MSKKKRAYLSVLIPACIFAAVVLIGIVYLLNIGHYVGTQDRWLDGPPKEASTYSLAFHFLEELFSWRNIVRLVAFSAALGFALWQLLSKRKEGAASYASLAACSGFGMLLSVIPLLFALLIPLSDTMAFASLGLADLLDGVVYPVARVLLFVAVAISISRLLSLYRDGLTASP